MDVSETVLQEYTLQDEELEETFNSLKFNKSPRFDDTFSSAAFFIHSMMFLIFQRGMKTA